MSAKIMQKQKGYPNDFLKEVTLEKFNAFSFGMFEAHRGEKTTYCYKENGKCVPCSQEFYRTLWAYFRAFNNFKTALYEAKIVHK